MFLGTNELDRIRVGGTFAVFVELGEGMDLWAASKTCRKAMGVNTFLSAADYVRFQSARRTCFWSVPSKRNRERLA